MKRTFLNTVLIGTLVVVSCKQEQPPPPPPVPVNLLTVKAQPVTYYDRYTATTVALNQVNILPEVQGYITGIYFKEGSHVKRGQKLYDIDRRIYEDNYNTAAANANVAEGNLKQAQQDADRYQYLNNNKAVAKQLYDHAMIALENSRNAYKSALEALKIAKTNLAYSEITAPFDGTVGFSMVKLGDLVSVGQTVLITISTDDPMAVDFLINEKQLAFFNNLQNANHQVIDSLFTLILPNGSLYSYTGSLSVIDRAVNPQTGAIRIRLLFPNPQLSLRVGMSCVVRVHNQDSVAQMLIPNRAVVEEMGEYFVYLVKDSVMSGGDQTGGKSPGASDPRFIALQKKVHLGAVIGPDVIIKDGIKEGDDIITDGIQSLHNGSPVAPSGGHSAPHGGKPNAQ
ncbi:MAG TPA: efflux RND transporter periplasmic adaptor subunit [Bacteroidota bacterium]|nr:efflux RND transporter periplasmic adaptor subunit [Bacteroidota bacterium]